MLDTVKLLNIFFLAYELIFHVCGCDVITIIISLKCVSLLRLSSITYSLFYFCMIIQYQY